MPAALDVDREQVKMLAINVGVREAARQMGLDENTVKQWSAREGWLKNLPRSHALPHTVLKPVTSVTTPSECLVNTLIAAAQETRANHVDVALRASRQLKKLPDEALIGQDQAQTSLAIAKHAALTAGWNADSRPDSPGKAFGGRSKGLEIDAEVLQPEEITAIETHETPASLDVDDY